MQPSSEQSDTPVISHENLTSILRYDGGSGRFFWRKNGKEAGHDSSGGRYMSVGVCGRVYRRSRLAWFYVNGSWPNGEVDHINGVRMDDRIENLRDVSPRVNRLNFPMHRAGKIPGVSVMLGPWNRKKKYISRIKTNGKTKFLGYFQTEKEAHAAYARELEIANAVEQPWAQ